MSSPFRFPETENPEIAAVAESLFLATCMILDESFSKEEVYAEMCAASDAALDLLEKITQREEENAILLEELEELQKEYDRSQERLKVLEERVRSRKRDASTQTTPQK